MQLFLEQNHNVLSLSIEIPSLKNMACGLKSPFSYINNPIKLYSPLY